MGKVVMQGFHASRKWFEVKSHSRLICINSTLTHHYLSQFLQFPHCGKHVLYLLMHMITFFFRNVQDWKWNVWPNMKRICDYMPKSMMKGENAKKEKGNEEKKKENKKN